MIRIIPIIIIFLIITLIIVTKNPDLHKPIIIGNSNITMTDKSAFQNSEIYIKHKEVSNQPVKASIENIDKIKNKNKFSLKEYSEYEDSIDWNEWRANISNLVAQNVNSKFSEIIPLGTIYTYNFEVDNRRKVYNISVRVSQGYVNSTTLKGAKMIEYSIKSLNGKPSLIFPNGTERSSVLISNAIRCAETSRNVTADQYDDIEKITRRIYK